MPDRPSAFWRPAPLHPVSRIHLHVLSEGGLGIMQHAVGPRPDPAHGSCTDDVSRALEVDLLHARALGWAAVSDSAWRNVRYLRDAFDPPSGTFRNFRDADGTWLDGTPSEDSQGRAMLALGIAMADAPDPRLVAMASGVFADALPQAVTVRALRAGASVLLGCDAAMRADPCEATDRAYRTLAIRLRTAFLRARDDAWPWPEPVLTYENAMPARALIVGGQWLGSAAMVDLGLRVLDWLIDVQVADDGRFSPVGNGWWTRDGERSRYDQQAIEATAMIRATRTAFDVTGDERYRAAMERAYAWFLGDNDLGVPIADPDRGAGHDGLTPDGVNANQGAESTLMWLIALEHIRALRATAPDVTTWPDRRVAGRGPGGGERMLVAGPAR